MEKAVIVMGSKADKSHCEEIKKCLAVFGVESEMRVASAHKVPVKAMDVIKSAESQDTVFITVAGRSNALSGFTDAQTFCPVIACPPYADKFAGSDVFSSLRMPSGVSVMTVLEPENAALAVAKIFALKNASIKEKVSQYQKNNREKLEKDDAEVTGK